MNQDIQPGRYRHFKGGEYEVIDLVLHSETEETLVLYRPLYGEGRLWVRPLDLFCDHKELDGRTVPRFQRIDDAAPVQDLQTRDRLSAHALSQSSCQDA